MCRATVRFPSGVSGPSVQRCVDSESSIGKDMSSIRLEMEDQFAPNSQTKDSATQPEIVV